jgi:secreted trypsin-like serine protease
MNLQWMVIAAMTLQPALALAQNVLVTETAAAGSANYKMAVDNYLNGKEPKIVGGVRAPAGSHPWQASLGVSWIDDPYMAHFCGASIIDERWIITAAHCLVDTSPNNVVVTLGTHSLGVGGSRHSVKRIVVNKGYKPSTSDNDIALIELVKPLRLDATVQKVPMLGPEDEATVLKRGISLMAVGWGRTTEGGTSVRDLRQVAVPFVERTECNRPLGYDGRITSNMICAGDKAGGKDSCQGDSGGPLTAQTAAHAVLAGIVSWGEGCARPNLVGVYTRVSVFKGWVESCMKAPAACQ